MPPADRHAGSADRLRRQTERAHAHVDRLVRAVASGDAPSERLHELHRSLRRLYLYTRFTPGREKRGRWRDARERLHRLAGLVGSVRDFDVGAELLGTLAAGAGEPGPLGLGAVRRRFVRDCAAARASLREELRPAQWERTNRALRERVRPATGPAADRWVERRLRGAIADDARALARAWERARHRPTTRRLHRLRIRLRGYRQLGRLVAQCLAEPTPPTAGLGRGLQRALGELHDWDQLRRALREVPKRAQSAEVEARVRERLRGARRRARRNLGRSAPELDRLLRLR